MNKSDVFEITCYDKLTGQIRDTGTTCLPETLETESTGVLVGAQAPTLDMHRVDLATKTIVPLPARPSLVHEFDFATLQWVDPRTEADVWAAVRAERDARLAETDWTQLPDVPLATKEVWATYRQALRDVTQQPDPRAIQWPEPPA
jgi:hypothetical protein